MLLDHVSKLSFTELSISHLNVHNVYASPIYLLWQSKRCFWQSEMQVRFMIAAYPVWTYVAESSHESIRFANTPASKSQLSHQIGMDHRRATEIIQIHKSACEIAANEPRHKITNNVVCATSKASDQPAHTRSLIRAFACR